MGFSTLKSTRETQYYYYYYVVEYGARSSSINNRNYITNNLVDFDFIILKILNI